jgi:hypothetical protein
VWLLADDIFSIEGKPEDGNKKERKRGRGREPEDGMKKERKKVEGRKKERGGEGREKKRRR